MPATSWCDVCLCYHRDPCTGPPGLDDDDDDEGDDLGLDDEGDDLDDDDDDLDE